MNNFEIHEAAQLMSECAGSKYQLARQLVTLIHQIEQSPKDLADVVAKFKKEHRL